MKGVERMNEIGGQNCLKTDFYAVGLEITLAKIKCAYKPFMEVFRELWKSMNIRMKQ